MSVPLVFDYDNLPVYKRNEDFLFKALSYKQEQLDANRAKVQNLYDQYSMLDIYRDVDKEYADQRLQQVKDFTNKFVAGDLSSEYLTQYVSSNLNEFVDDNVINAVTSTKRFKNEMNEWEQARKETPDKYNEINRQYAISNNPNYHNWINSEEVGSLYQGGSGFIEYVDVNKRILENLPKAMKDLREEWVKTQPGSGIFRDKVTMERVPRNRMEKVLDLVIGGDGRRQMQINAWAEARPLDEETVRQSFTSYYQGKLGDTNRDIKALENQLAKSTGSKKEAIQAEIDSLKGDQSYFKRNLDNAPSMGKDQMYSDLYEKRFKMDALDAYSYHPRVLKKDIDRNDLESKKFQFELEKFEHKKMMDMLEGSGTKRGKGLGADGRERPLPGRELLSEEVGVDYSATASLQEQVHQKGNEYYTSLKEATGLELTNAEWSEVMSKIDENTLSDKSNISIELSNGKTANIDLNAKGVKDNILGLRSHILGDTPHIKEFRKSIRELRDTGILFSSSDLDLMKQTALSIGQAVVEEDDGTFTVRQITPEDAESLANKLNSYVGSTSRQRRVGGFLGTELTKAEAKTLQIWKSALLLSDNSVPEYIREEAYNTFASDYVEQGFDLKGIETVLGTVDDIRAKEEPQEAPASQTIPGSTILTTLIDPRAGEATAKTFEVKNTDSLIDKEALKVFDNKSEQILKDHEQAFKTSHRAMLVGKDHMPELHSDLRVLADVPQNFKGPFEIHRVFKEDGSYGIKINWPEWVSPGSGEAKEKKMQSKLIDYEQVLSLDLNLGELSISNYDLDRFGENAPSLNMGSSTPSTNKLEDLDTQYGNKALSVFSKSSFWNPFEESLVQSDVPQEKAQEYVEFRDAFFKGDINFRLQNVRGKRYRYEMVTPNGEVIHYQDVPERNISDAGLSVLTEQSPFIKNDLVIDYLQNMLGQSDSETVIFDISN